jgi:hypothetical protein
MGGECGHDNWYASLDEGGCITQQIGTVYECPERRLASALNISPAITANH